VAERLRIRHDPQYAHKPRFTPAEQPAVPEPMPVNTTDDVTMPTTGPSSVQATDAPPPAVTETAEKTRSPTGYTPGCSPEQHSAEMEVDPPNLSAAYFTKLEQEMFDETGELRMT